MNHGIQKYRSTSATGLGMAAASGDAALLQNLQRVSDQINLADSSAARLVFAREGINDGHLATLNQIDQNLSAVLDQVVGALGYRNAKNAGVIAACESAATLAGMGIAAGVEFARRNTSIAGLRSDISGVEVFSESAEHVPAYHGKRADRIVAAMESFDQREQKNAALYTLGFNFSVALQSEFGETLYPLLTLPSDQVGFGIVVNRLTVHKGQTHASTGAVSELKKIDLVRAPVDASVLSRKKNRVVPVVRAGNVDKFVDAGVIPAAAYTEEGANFNTAPYKVGVEVDLLGISQTDAQLAAGARTQIDSIDPAASLEAIYLQIGTDVVKLPVYGLTGSNFVYNQQGRPEDRRLSFRNKNIKLIAAKTKLFDGTAFVDLAPINTHSLTVVLDITLDGTLNTEFGTVDVRAPRVQVVRLEDANGVAVTSGAGYTAVMAALVSPTIIGYDLRAFLTNVSLRERGDYIDSSQFVQLYEVPLLSPITAQRPVHSNGEFDASDYEKLVTTVRFRLYGDSVTAILEAVDRLEQYASTPLLNEDAPSGLGAARFHVKPYFKTDSVDVSAITSTLDSVSAARNVAAVLVNKIRDAAFLAYIYSEYESAQLATGYVGPTTVIIATDPYIRRYLQLDGEVRLASEKFDVKIVDTLDKRFRGKLFITFGVFGEDRNSAPNILNWGNLIYAPEVVVSSNLPQGTGIARETIVQPRYRFVEHLPVGVMISVTGITAAMATNLLRMDQV